MSQALAVLDRLSASGASERKSGCGFGQRIPEFADMVLFGKIADHHHSQHTVSIHPGFRDPPVAVTCDFLNDASMHFRKMFRAELRRLESERDNRKKMLLRGIEQADSIACGRRLRRIGDLL